MKIMMVVLCLLIAGNAFGQDTDSLSEAVKNYNVGKVSELLKNGGDPNVLVNNEPAICYIARTEGITTHYIMMELIAYGANPNSISKEGYSVTALALANRNAEAATELIKKGANLNTPIKEGIFPPLLIAVTRIQQYGPAHRIKGKELVQLMMDHHADVNAQNSNKSTALSIVTDANDLEMVKYFLDHKANPNLKDSSGVTPLMKAAGAGRSEIVKLLLDRGADPNVIPGDKETAIMRAAKEGRKNEVLLLLEKGANIKGKNNYKETALRLAELGGHKEVVEILKKATKKK